VSTNPAVDDLRGLTGWDGGRATIDWAPLSEALGLGVPDDFRALTQAFPYGVFQEWVRLMHPTNAPDAASWVANLRGACDGLRLWRDKFVPDFGYGLYPEPGGLLPWAEMDNEEYFCWVTQGPPNDWPTVVCNRALERGDAHPTGAARFLVGLFRGTVDEPFLADWRDDFTRTPVSFEAF
jgi:hypothetical protein